MLMFISARDITGRYQAAGKCRDAKHVNKMINWRKIVLSTVDLASARVRFARPATHLPINVEINPIASVQDI